MKELFMQILDLVNAKGNINELNLYPSGVFSKIVVETNDGTYSITIVKEEEKKDA